MTGTLTAPTLSSTTVNTSDINSDSIDNSGTITSATFSGNTGNITTINVTDVNSDSINNSGTITSSIFSGNTGNITTINATDVNSTNATISGGTLQLTYGIAVDGIGSTTGSTPNSATTLLTEEAILNIFSTSNELGELTDVTLTNPQLNDILVYDGSSQWVNTGQSYLDDLYVNVDGDTMTGDLTIETLSGTGDRLVYVDTNGQLQESDEYVYKPASVLVGPGTENIDSVSTAVTYGTVWHYYVEDGTNYRSGIITGVWGAGDICMNETSTRDIGDTSDIDFDLVLSGSTAVLQALGGGTANYNVKVARMII
jgi:hypothetical protein